MIFVDTDIMIDIFRDYSYAITWLDTLGNEEIILPGFVVMELIQGCGNKMELEKVKKELETYAVIWPTPEICDRALSVFFSYRLSHGIGIIDVLIGQMSVALDLPLHTFNKKHYAAIPSIKTIQPYQKGSYSL